ncbi:hypothetical protein F4779DRAFT_368041 [Xylariaceae sp. FL0662B]|nr:hypothetical protein F4779DRAFT_368041 [Xylariaceae sp. FL0662B]
MATDWNKLKVVDLKAELKRLGLPQNGLKADLVSRLEAAASKNVVSESPDHSADEPMADINGDAHQQQDAPEPPETSLPNESVQQAELDPQPEPQAEPQAEPQPAPAMQDTSSTADTQNQAPLAPPSPSTTPLPPTEFAQDSQKRKRRSVTPAPSADDIARKRPRQEYEENKTHDASDSIPAKVDEMEHEKDGGEEFLEAPSKEDMETTRNEGSVERKDEDNERIGKKDIAENAPADVQNGYFSEAPTADLEPTPQEAHTDKPGHREQPYDSYPSEIERDVEPSIHPATSALYIKNFMRPLRPQAVRDHLLELATPPGISVDTDTIVDFYLDNIRTHAFATFNTISAASRVRNALHDRVWPDETNRKALWVDFIPAESFAEWVDIEQGLAGPRGSTNRYEVVYENDHEGNVTARLEERDAAYPAVKQPPPPPVPQPERKASIPTGPSRSFLGVEGAPLGPRGFQPSRGTMLHSNRMDRLDPPFLSTRTYPSIKYQPVPDELARRRQDSISAAKAKDYDRDFGKEYKRYYFEHGDILVDRGPEIFLGIRPPHRERERQRDQVRGRRGGGGGGGGRRRGGRMPAYHGVPRGGDRFRPQGSSGASFGDRPRYEDDRGGRWGNRY